MDWYLTGSPRRHFGQVGPGAWSIDARLFGRKRIDMPEL
jgi:hypothetical protein